MQSRTISKLPLTRSPLGDEVKVPPSYWENLSRRNLEELCRNALVKLHVPEGLLVRFLGRNIMVDFQEKCLKRAGHGKWERIEYPLMEILFLIYLLNIGPDPLENEIISAKELKSSHFFQGPHALEIEPLIERFGYEPDAFARAAESLGGERENLGDLGYRVPVFPKVPVYYALWQGDEEFEPRFSIFFDRSIEKHLSADAIWGLAKLASDALLKAPDLPF